MNTRHLISLIAITGALGLLAGCASSPDSHLVSAPPPPAPTAAAGVAPAPQPAQVVATVVVPGAVNSYIVVQAPPAPQPEAVPPRPSSQHAWLAGYWTWQDNRYAWMAGHWELPPAGATAWVNPRWEPEGRNFRFYEGYWR